MKDVQRTASGCPSSPHNNETVGTESVQRIIPHFKKWRHQKPGEVQCSDLIKGLFNIVSQGPAWHRRHLLPLLPHSFAVSHFGSFISCPLSPGWASSSLFCYIALIWASSLWITYGITDWKASLFLPLLLSSLSLTPSSLIHLPKPRINIHAHPRVSQAFPLPPCHPISATSSSSFLIGPRLSGLVLSCHSSFSAACLSVFPLSPPLSSPLPRISLLRLLFWRSDYGSVQAPGQAFFFLTLY